jgi:hypothetical protein
MVRAFIYNVLKWSLGGVFMLNYYFVIEGSKETGSYIVYEVSHLVRKLIFETHGAHRGGLKISRQKIGEYLQTMGLSSNDAFYHQCNKPGRKNNPILKWTVSEYLIGVPQ